MIIFASIFIQTFLFITEKNKFKFMKKVVTLVFCALMMLSAAAQEVFENSYLTIRIPKGWTLENMELGNGMMEVVTFYKEGMPTNNLGLLVGTEQSMSPDMLIATAQMMESPIFTGAIFEDVCNAKFMGYPARMANFANIINGVSYKGAMYAFKKDNCTLCAVGAYREGFPSDLPQIWRSIRWKERKRTQKYSSLAEEVRAFVDAMNASLSVAEQTALGISVVAYEFTESPYCYGIHFRMNEIDTDNWSAEDLEDFRTTVRNQLPSAIAVAAQSNDLIRRCTDAGYNFKYVYFDKNNKEILNVTLTPDEYRQ